MEKPFHCSTMWGGKFVTDAIMYLLGTSSTYKIKPFIPGKIKPKALGPCNNGGGGGGNFNKTLLEPLGTKVIVHLKPDKKITGSSCSGWVVPCTRHGTLYMLQGICHNN